jgi:hypothetical protein
MFRLLLVDWPWKFGDSLPGKKRGASKNYVCMPAERAGWTQFGRQLRRE